MTQKDRWELIRWMPYGYEDALDDVKSGTMVIWSYLDRVIPVSRRIDDESAKRKFSEAFDRVKRHLSMTYQRFIERGAVKLFWCSREVKPWNPFCLSKGKIQALPTEYIGENISVKGYVLPHKNNFSSESVYKAAEGVYGFSAHQGFYVYRGDRLLLAGD